jgi:sugar phosphate isomerase/epimerase
MTKAPQVTQVKTMGIDHLTMLDVPPPDLVTMASEAGFDSVGIRVSAATPGEQQWPMTKGSPMLEETVRRLRDMGMQALNVEVLRISSNTRGEDYEHILESGARLGARYISVNSDDPDLDRAADTFSSLVEAAKSYSLRPLIEPIIYTRVQNLDQAVEIAERSDGGGVLLDALHFRRYGGRFEQLRSLDPRLIPSLQLNDAPLDPPDGLSRPERLPLGQSTDGSDLQVESRAWRLLPGEGELPLAELISAMPGEFTLSIEAPALSLRETLSPTDFARRARESLDTVLDAAANV